MSDASSADPPPDPLEGRGRSERLPRTNLLLAAAIEAGTLKTSVRIRNLSESGALLEGAAFPNIGEKLTLRRQDIEIGATVVWRVGARCGVKFDGTTSVAEWVSGKRSASPGQARVDSLQAAIRAGSPALGPTDRVSAGQAEIEGDLDHRIAEELAHVQRLLENMGDRLTDEPIIVHRHSKTLQDFDLACQILGHLAAILTAENRGAAVDGIGMEDLRARLLRKPLFKDK